LTDLLDYERDQERHNAVSSRESDVSIDGDGSVRLSHTPESQHSGNSQRGIHEPADIASVSNRSTSVVGEHSQDSPLEEADEEACRCESPKLSYPTQNMSQPDADANDGSKADCIGEEDSNTHQGRKTLEAQVTGFRAWKKPHRTDEHITPGVYRGFWKWLARCFTFYMPSWFLKNFFKMHDLRRRLAFRQKLLFCVLLAAIYALLCYFLIIQPIASCVVKVQIGMIPNHSPFCRVVGDVIYVYMGLCGAFMLLVAFCVARVRYTSRTFEEHDTLLVMHIPCYNENESVLRKTIESCVESSYEKKRKLLFIVADGTVAAAG
jgi:hypothetical protein